MTAIPTRLPLSQIASIAPEGLTISLTKNALGELGGFIGSAEKTVHGELFRLGESSIQGAINSASARGVRQHFLMDPEGAASIKAALPKPGVTAKPYAKMPFKNHSKGTVVDGDRAMMTTGAIVPKTSTRVEMVAKFQGEAARALQELMEAGASRWSVQTGRLARAADDAARYGIVVNEPRAGVQHLTGAVHQMIAAAKKDIIVSTKIFTDPTVRAAIAKAEARGVRVRFTDIRANDMHANMLIADDMTYIGTAHFSPRGMGDMRMAYRRSRESGIVVRDAEYATTLRQHLDDQGMRVYTPEEFERSRVAYAKMDAHHKAVENGVTGDELAASTASYEQGLAEWRAVRSEVFDRRAADGMSFTNPDGFPPEAWAAGADDALAGAADLHKMPLDHAKLLVVDGQVQRANGVAWDAANVPNPAEVFGNRAANAG